jgi:exodeoxyribonuclease-3
MKKYTLIIFCTLLIGTAGFSQSTLKVLSYNVLHGFENDSAKMTTYVDRVSKLDPDIIAYEELNDFTQEKLETLAKRYSHPYVAINLGRDDELK